MAGVTARRGRPGGTRRGVHRLLAAAGCCAIPLTAAGTPGFTRPASPAQTASALVIVAGVGGTPEHRERFTLWATELCAAAVTAPGAGEVRVLVERPPAEPPPEGPCAPRGRSTREEVAREIRAAVTPAGAGLVLVLIGHGAAGSSPRFQLPGPDLSPEHLSEILADVGAGAVTVAHLGSAAGAFLPALSGPGRVLLAASRATETIETRFPRHFVAAFAGDDADTDKDGQLSALEAFDFARREVEREYEREGLIRTEHALLDDNGDGVGSFEPEMAPGGDGVLAGRRPLLFRTREAVLAGGVEAPEIRRLVAERDGLAARVDALREVRGSMAEEAYFAELEALLLQIAELSERISALRENPR